MTSITPAEIPLPTSPAEPTQPGGYRYVRGEELISYRVSFRPVAPARLRVHLELFQEDEGVWARIPELDVSAEGADVKEAFMNVLAAAREWLSYIREEEPSLSDDLLAQARYAALLDSPSFSWFAGIKLG